MQVAFSSILKQNDDFGLNSKLLLSGLDFIDSSNLRYGDISFDGIHINDGGSKCLIQILVNR